MKKLLFFIISMALANNFVFAGEKHYNAHFETKDGRHMCGTFGDSSHTFEPCEAIGIVYDENHIVVEGKKPTFRHSGIAIVAGEKFCSDTGKEAEKLSECDKIYTSTNDSGSKICTIKDGDETCEDQEIKSETTSATQKTIASASTGAISKSECSVGGKPVDCEELTQKTKKAFGIVFYVLSIIPWILFIFFAYCYYTIFKKLKIENAWLSWIPVIQIVPLLKSAGMSLWWILGLMVPFLNIYVLVTALHRGVSLRTGHDAGWTIGLVFVGIIFLPLTAFTYKPEETQAPASPIITTV